MQQSICVNDHSSINSLDKPSNSSDEEYQKIDTRIQIIVIQDAAELNETKLRVSSVPLLQKLLRNCRVCVIGRSKRTKLDIGIDLTDESVVVLYPSLEAKPICDISNKPIPQMNPSTEPFSDSCSQHGIRTIVILDGSWVAVQNILYRFPSLQPHRLRHVFLPASCTSESAYELYGLRKEPHKHFLSTAEAIAWSLMLLNDSERAFHAIMTEFDKFVRTKLSDTHSKINEELLTTDISSRIHAPWTHVYDSTFAAGSDEIRLPSRGKPEKKKVSKACKRRKRRSRGN